MLGARVSTAAEKLRGDGLLAGGGPTSSAGGGGGAPPSDDASTPARAPPGARAPFSSPRSLGGRRRSTHPFGPRLSSLIGRLGRFSAERPRAVLGCCFLAALLCALLLATGMVRIVVESDSTRLWVPKGTSVQFDAYTSLFEEPLTAVAIVSSAEGDSMTQLPQIIEAVQLDERLRTQRSVRGASARTGPDFEDVCYRAAPGAQCLPSSIFTLWNNTAPSPSHMSAAVPMIRAAIHAATGSGGLDLAMADYLGCMEKLPAQNMATFRMLRFVYQLQPGPNASAWADAFQRSTLHGRYEHIRVDSVVPGSYDAELSGMSWDDLVLTLYWLPMILGAVPLYMARNHNLRASEACQLLLLEICAICLSITGALVAMALCGLTISPMWLAAPLLAMGYGLDDMFVLLSAFSEVRRAAHGSRPQLLEHIQLAFESAGISCLCTSLTSFVVFVIGGATSSVLAIQSFCWLSALIALLDFGLQVAVFGAAMALVLGPRYAAEEAGHRAARDAQRAAAAHAAAPSPLALNELAARGGAGEAEAEEDEEPATAAAHARALAPELPPIFAEPYADARYGAKASPERLARYFGRTPPIWAQVLTHYTFIPLVTILLICTYCATDLTAGEVPLGIDVAGLAKAGSYLIDFDAHSRECFNQGEWAYVYVKGGGAHEFGYQAQLREVVGAVKASSAVDSVSPWLLQFVDGYAAANGTAPPPTAALPAAAAHSSGGGGGAVAEYDAVAAFSVALRAYLTEPKHEHNAANLAWARRSAPPPPAAGAADAIAAADADAGGAAARADCASALAAGPSAMLSTAAVDALPGGAASAVVCALRIPLKLAPCDDDETDGESRHECELRAMLTVQAEVASHKGALDAAPVAQSWLGLQQYVTMRADVRRALLRCTLAAAAVTFGLVLGYSVWEALLVSLICLLSLALCNVIILGVMKYFSMHLHFLSAVMLQMGVGFIVDYHIHIASKFMATRVGATATRRVVKTIESVGSAVLASAVTTLFVVLPFLWARWAAMRLLMTLMFIVIAVGAVFSLGFLPIVLAFVPRTALAPAPGRRRQAALLLANAQRMSPEARRAAVEAAAAAAAPDAAAYPDDVAAAAGQPGHALGAHAAVLALRVRAAARLQAAWRGFWQRKQYVAHQQSNALFLSEWKAKAVHAPPTLPARLTMHAPVVSNLRRNVYLSLTGLHVTLISCSFVWEQWVLWHQAPLDPVALVLSFITFYLTAFFCGFITTMAEPKERHNIALNALAPLHPSLARPDAHVGRAPRGGAPAPAPAPGAGSAQPPRAHARRGLFPKSEWPKVAIVVPCYKEPDDIIAKTIAACLRQVYPPSRLHVFLLDDNQNQPVRDARKAVMLEAYRECFQLHTGGWLPEEKRPGFDVVWRPDNSHAKAGNMNHWLQSTDHGFDWEFFVLFDCDMVPHGLFVQEMLPAMLHVVHLPTTATTTGADGGPTPPTRDGRGGAGAATEPSAPPLRVVADRSVAFIATRQVFGDAPPLDPLGHRQDMMYDTWEPALDATDQALFLGTNAIFSRAAVESVGGFPTNCLTEDTLICLRLHTAGYRALYYPRTFTRGLAPDTIRSAFRQRCRWAHGNLQILWRYNPLWNRKLDLKMRTVFTTVLAVNVSGFPLILMACFSFGVQLKVIAMPVLPVALGLIKLAVWGLQYCLLFNTPHCNPWLARPLLHVWRQTQMALCFTFCGVQVFIDETWKLLKAKLCNVQTITVFQATIDTTRVELPHPPEIVQIKMGIFLVAIALIFAQWYKTLLPLVSDVPVDPDDFTYLVAAWLLMALPVMLGYPWVKIFISELRKIGVCRAFGCGARLEPPAKPAPA